MRLSPFDGIKNVLKSPTANTGHCVIRAFGVNCVDRDNGPEAKGGGMCERARIGSPRERMELSNAERFV